MKKKSFRNGKWKKKEWKKRGKTSERLFRENNIPKINWVPWVFFCFCVFLKSFANTILVAPLRKCGFNFRRSDVVFDNQLWKTVFSREKKFFWKYLITGPLNEAHFLSVIFSMIAIIFFSAAALMLEMHCFWRNLAGSRAEGFSYSHYQSLCLKARTASFYFLTSEWKTVHYQVKFCKPCFCYENVLNESWDNSFWLFLIKWT